MFLFSRSRRNINSLIRINSCTVKILTQTHKFSQNVYLRKNIDNNNSTNKVVNDEKNKENEENEAINTFTESKRYEFSNLENSKNITIKGFGNDWFQLTNGATITNQDDFAAFLTGPFAFKLKIKLDSNNANLISNIIELDIPSLKIFEILDPKPDILVVGTGERIRLMGPKTKNYFASLGIQLESSSTVSAFNSYDILQSSKPGSVSALFFPLGF